MDFAALDHPVPRKKKDRKKLHQSRLISGRHNACLCNPYNKSSVKNIISYACLSTKILKLHEPTINKRCIIIDIRINCKLS